MRIRTAGQWRRLRRWACGAAAWAALSGLAGVADANPITLLVTNANDAGHSSLRSSLQNAVNNPLFEWRIVFHPSLEGQTITLESPLPIFTGNLTIDGVNAPNLTISGGDVQRLFFVNGGTLNLANLTLAEGAAIGGNGGDGANGGGGGLGAGAAIFVNSGATVSVENVTFAQNSAQGGAGGNYNDMLLGGGGGGGLHGHGGTQITLGIGDRSGGGGGGMYGDGGDGIMAYGGGGGGQLLDGADGDFILFQGGAGGGAEGGMGGSDQNSAQNAAAIGGGGGGGGVQADAFGGAGQDFGGGGGGGFVADHHVIAETSGGAGGFGGGGGGAGDGSPQDAAAGGFGGGAGGVAYGGGGGGAAFGGAVFVRQGGSLTIVDSTFTQNTVVGGQAGTGDALLLASVDDDDEQEAGSALYIMAGVTVSFSVSADGAIEFEDTIGGAGSLTKLGAGQLTLAGDNTYTGATTISAGRLVVNGQLTSDTTIEADGELGGSGSIFGAVVNNGLFAPGNSIGQLNIHGDYTHGAGAKLQIEIDDHGHTDLVTVAGDVILNGGVVEVVAASGSYAAQQSYTFLTYTGQRTGEFDAITIDLAFFNAVLDYDDPHHLIRFYLQANNSNFVDLALTKNQLKIAQLLDDNNHGALQDLIDQLTPLTTSDVQHALDQLSGEVYGTSLITQFQTTSYQMQLLAQQLRPGLGGYGGVGRASPTGGVMLASVDRATGDLVIRGQNCCAPARQAWALGYGLGGNAQSDGVAAGLNYAVGGLQLGVENWLDSDVLVGVYGGYAGSRIDGVGSDHRVLAHSGQFGGYYRRDDGCDYWLLAGGFGFDDYRSTRSIVVGNIVETAAGAYDGWQGVAYAERGRTFCRGEFELQPYAALQYLYVRQNSFSETGAPNAGLDVDGLDANSLRGLLGLRAARPTITRGGHIVAPLVRAAWLHEFLDANAVSQARFGAVGGTGFTVDGLNLGRDWALFGAGLEWRVSQQLTVTGNYDLQVNDRQAFHVGSGLVQYAW